MFLLSYSVFCFLNPQSSTYFSVLRDYILDVDLLMQLSLFLPIFDGYVGSFSIFWLYGLTLDLFVHGPEQDDSTLSNSLFFYHGLCAIIGTYVSLFLIAPPSHALDDDEGQLPISEGSTMVALVLGSMWSVQEVLWGGVWSWDSVETVLLLSIVFSVGSIHGSSSSLNGGSITTSLLFFVLSFYSSQPQFSNSIHAFTTSSNDLIQAPILLILMGLPFWPGIVGTLQNGSFDKKGQVYPCFFAAICLSFSMGVELSSWVPEVLLTSFLVFYSHRSLIFPILDVRLFIVNCRLRVKKTGLHLHFIVIVFLINVVSFTTNPYGQPINNYISGLDSTSNKLDLFWSMEDGCFGRSNLVLELCIYNDSIFDIVRFIPLLGNGTVGIWLLNQASIWPIYFLYPVSILIFSRIKPRHFICLIIFFLSIEWGPLPRFLIISCSNSMLNLDINRP